MSYPLRVTTSQWSDIREHYEDEPDPDDFEELPTHCLECGVELEAGEDVLCRACVAVINRPPEPAVDEFLMDRYDEINGDSEQD